MKLRVIALLALLLFLPAVRAQLASPWSNSVWPAQIFTGSGQTGAIQQLNGLTSPSSTIGSSFATGTITAVGTSLTTATFAVMGSSDNGQTYYALPIYAVTSFPIGPNPAAAVTVTANAIFRVHLNGITHIKLVTSGTFAGTNLSLVLTTSPQVGVF